MPRFFNRIRKQLAKDNKFFQYSRYAIGEILLVVIGILIALQINDWNEERKNQNTLKGYLVFLLEDIESDKIQLTKLIKEREESLSATTNIINSYKHQLPIKNSEFLYAFNFIVVEKKFKNNTDGFDKVQSSILFDSSQFQKVRTLIREYQKQIDEVQYVESKQNTSSEIMETELMRNGFYDSNWDDFRAYYQSDNYSLRNDSTKYLDEINRYSEVKAIFLRNEWALPFIIRDYKSIISTGEALRTTIESYIN